MNVNYILFHSSRTGVFLVLSFLICWPIHFLEGQKIFTQALWEQGAGVYNNYRIPSVIRTPAGTLLAFCEGRSAGDTGDIDLLMRRSKDNGKTWGTEIVVWNDSKNTCGNPCPVVDEETGRIWLFMTWNNGEDPEKAIIQKKSKDTRWPYLCYSDDDGFTWSRPERMPDLRDESWGWYATGPGIGIQVKDGIYKGRLIIPANHSYDDPEGHITGGPFGYGSHVLYSDDHGQTWKKSEPIRPGCNESQVVELTDGRLMMNMRSYNDRYSRAVSYSTDGGETWSEIVHDDQLVESRCQAGFLNFGKYKKSRFLLFSNPAVPIGRRAMTVRLSSDDGRSWTNSKLIYGGPSAYSSMVRLPGNRIGLFFEAGVQHPYEKLLFVSLPISSFFGSQSVLSENLSLD